MPRSAHQKEKLIALLELFQRETDEEHPMTLPQLAAALEQQGISAERKSLYDDIATLQARGWDILRDRNRGYWLASREFELAELKLLVDAVQSSRFISERKCRTLTRKLESLCSRHQAGALQRQVLVSGRVRTMNESVLYSIDSIHDAIGQNKMLSFQYFDYNAAKEKVFRHDGATYLVSPLALLRSEDNYYLVARPESGGEARHYRVDRMANPAVVDRPRSADGQPVDLSGYTSRHFGMFSGKTRPVRLRCPTGLTHVILDRFGLDVMLIPDGADRFTVTVDVAVSRQFYGWLFGLGDEVEVLAPPDVRAELSDALRRAAARYE